MKVEQPIGRSRNSFLEKDLWSFLGNVLAMAQGAETQKDENDRGQNDITYWHKFTSLVSLVRNPMFWFF
jgi:hypothetical protein